VAEQRCGDLGHGLSPGSGQGWSRRQRREAEEPSGGRKKTRLGVMCSTVLGRFIFKRKGQGKKRRELLKKWMHVQNVVGIFFSQEKGHDS
jgi:hypothetical protein